MIELDSYLFRGGCAADSRNAGVCAGTVRVWEARCHSQATLVSPGVTLRYSLYFAALTAINARGAANLRIW